MKKFKITSLLFLAAGLGIIIAAFFLALKEHQAEDLFYLNLVVTCLVFIVVFLRASDIFAPLDKVAKSSSGYGLKWYGVWVYVPLALGLVVCSILFSLSFTFCLIGHLILLFILLFHFFLGSVVQTNVNHVEDKIQARKSGLREIAAQIDLLEMQSRLTPGASYQEAIDKLREGVRFITASDNPSAVAFEAKLLEKIRLMTGQIERQTQPEEVLRKEFEECMTLIELRKKQY